MSRDKEPEKIVPYDSAEAASIQTVTGWVSPELRRLPKAVRRPKGANLERLVMR